MLEGKQVRHIKYGNGTVTQETEGHVRVLFEDGKSEKTFLYPDAFEIFLTFQDEQLQKEAVILYTKKNEQASQLARERAEQFHQMDVARRKARRERLKKAKQ